ncbi:hypothetical protein, partial [Veillonella montpellierensis]|uniref:hypothetical protein n=1 Tax=Veillonella montpellierensis TaxID=187328 RepID=UPI000571AC07
MGRYSDLLNGVYEKTDAYKKALVDSGYEPNENTGFVDTMQSAAWGSLGGTLGFVSALGQKTGMDGVRDWALNEAQYAGKRAAVNADLTNYQDNGFTDYRYWTNGHIFSDTANLIGSNLVDVGLIGGSIVGSVLAAPETGGMSLAGGAAMVGSVVAKRAAQHAGKAVVKKLLGDAAENLATRAVTKYGFEEGAKLFSKDMLMEGLKQGGMKAAKNVAEYTTSSIAENTSNAGQVYMDSLARGVDFDTATDRSMQAFGDGVVPSLAEYGIEKMGVTGSLAALATKGGKVFTKALRGAAVNAAITGQLEGGVEAWQSLVQDRAMGEDNGAELLKPSTWTDNMKDSYNAAVGPSMLLGAFGGARNGIANRGNNNVATTIDINPQLEQPTDTQTTATSTPLTLGEVAETMNGSNVSVNAPDISQPVTSSNPIANVLVNDDVTGNSAIDSNAIGSDYIDMSNMSIPSNMGEQAIANSNVANDVADLSNTNTVDPHQDIKNEMHERFAKENKVDEVIGSKDKTFADMAAKYSEFYKDQPLDVIHQLKPKDFKEDFINEGFNKTEANHASRLIADNLKKENPLPKINGQEVIDSANQSGVELTPKEIEALQQENPPHAVINNINKRIEKQQEKAYKEGQKQEKAQLKENIKQNKADEERRLQQKDKRQEKKYTDNEYPTSSNKAFFDTVFKDDAPSVAYKFKKAMKKRNQDISQGKQHVNNVKQYLANEGIISEKYGKDKINALSEYTKAMDNERIQAKSIADPKQRKDFLTKSGINHSNLINFNKHIDNIIQNNQGLPNKEVLDKIDESMVKYHNEFGNVTQSKYYQKLVNQAKGNQTLAKARLQRINQAIGLDTPYQSTKEIKKEIVGEKEPKQRKPREVKKKPIKGHLEVANLLENKSSLEDTHKALEALSKSDELNDGQKIHIKQIQNAIKKNTDDKGVFKAKELDNTGKKALNKLNELQADMNAKHGVMTTSQFDEALKGIRDRAYSLFNKYPNKETLAKLETIDHTYKTPDNKTVAKMIKEGTASIPSKIHKSVMDSSAGFNDKASEWVNKEFNKKSDKVESAIRNEIIANTLKKAYDALLKKFGTIDKAIESDQLAVRQFVRNVIAAFPKGKFGELDKDLKAKGDNARENLFGSSKSQALTQRVSDGFAPLIDFVKQYNEKIKADKKAEKQAKQENTIKAVKTRASDEGIRVAKYKATINVDNGTNELAPIRVTFTFDDKKDATEDNARNIAEELGNKYYFSPDEMEFVEQKDNSVAFDTIAGLSYSDLSNAQTLHASVVAMRAKVIKATLDNNEKEEMMFEIPHNASFDGLKDAINDAYGKGTYDFIRETVRGTTVYDNDSTDTIYVVKKGTELTEDKKDELTGAYYQQGKDEPVKRTENKHVDTDTLKGVSHIFDNADKGYKLSIGEQRKLLDSIVYYVGEQANDVFAYLEKATYLSINKLDSNTVENGKINRGLGKVFLKQKQLTNTSSTFLHEMAHDAVFNVLESKNKSKRK